MSDFWKAAVAEHDHRLVLSLLAAGLRLDEARDVAQEAWMRVMESAAAGRLERIELPGLVLRQASFIVTDRVRMKKVRVHAPLAEAAELASEESAEHATSAQQVLEVLEAGLVHATPRERSVLRSTLERPDERHDSLAASAGISVQRFRQVLCSVRAKLRRALEGT
ncbi:MAG: sigma-70 family RNA polymerase sigma factor [Archangium sp.]|nr:sigma-70 family RNA polymerase sigma factor [Archangium sp.]